MLKQTEYHWWFLLRFKPIGVSDNNMKNQIASGWRNTFRVLKTRIWAANGLLRIRMCDVERQVTTCDCLRARVNPETDKKDLLSRAPLRSLNARSPSACAGSKLEAPRLPWTTAAPGAWLTWQRAGTGTLTRTLTKGQCGSRTTLQGGPNYDDITDTSWTIWVTPMYRELPLPWRVTSVPAATHTHWPWAHAPPGLKRGRTRNVFSMMPET